MAFLTSFGKKKKSSLHLWKEISGTYRLQFVSDVSMQITVKEHEFDEVVSGPTQAINIDKM
jgi:hypothetical protein